MNLYLDIETRSRVNIENGTDAYTHASEPLLVGWAVDHGPVQHAVTEGRQLPASFIEVFNKADRLIAHNAQFDRAALEQCGLTRPMEAWHCTMSQAYAHGLPGSLAALCSWFRVPTPKQDGKRLIRLFCIPQRDDEFTSFAERPAEAAEFISYLRDDVEALRQVHAALPDWNEERERAIRVADAYINHRGVGVDIDLAARLVVLLAKAAHEADAQLLELTAGCADGATDRNGLLEWLASRGLPLTSLDKESISRALATTGLDDDVRQVLALRQRYSQASVSKYDTIVDASVGGRLRYTLQYAGASRTGRWSGRTFQPQNLPRPKRKAADIDAAIVAVKAGAQVRDDITDLAVDMVRGVLVPKAGYEFVVADLSNIEGRVLAWVAGEEWKLEAFREFDAKRGPDIYIASYSAAFGVPVDKVTKDQRQVGKVMELALGYQGGVGAFVTMAKGYNLDLDALAGLVLSGIDVGRARSQAAQAHAKYIERAEDAPLSLDTYAGITALVQRWRRAHPATVKLWADLQQAFTEVAVTDDATALVRSMTIDRVGGCVRLLLPSGRFLCYHGLSMDPRMKALTVPAPNDLVKWRTNPRMVTTLYGGKATENICQSLARDVLAEALVDLHRPGAPFQTVLHVHDEVVVEAVPGAFGVEHLVAKMTAPRAWAEGLPLAAAGYRCNRYRKE
ncbi:bifunctional 3'-5' exonuclease/DNA polymerase [uncultured Caudovirales phage]|uniref:Bifunctional 3'-5' exonuclease/DNA polymerase n=1 Tax=uncultured Caudovirales phage TaxID=2100421 RepID=A0A6J5NZR9_9CAUD|nr:bifunctional 3'-5' exonuclease/DNA polymerase [uncultured Caudovirales phage]